MQGSKPHNHVEFTAQVGSPPDAVFTYLTDHFFEIWPGKGEVLTPGDDPAEPNGLGMVRRVDPPGSASLEERIITHERPGLIEYTVINEAPISNHLGRIELSPIAGGTAIRYTIDFDYRPAALGPVVCATLRATWALISRRRLRSALGASPG